VDDAEIISAYSRALAIADRAVVDVTATAHEAGLKWPVAITRAAWNEMCEWPGSADVRRDVHRGPQVVEQWTRPTATCSTGMATS
jgi:hypothetical protein